MTEFKLTQLFRHPQYYLLGLIASLFSVYLALVWRVGELTHLGMSGLFLLAALTLIWENAPNYRYRHDRIASVTAVILIGWVLWQSTVIVNEFQLQLRLIPFVSALAVALLASGFQGLLQYRRELALMFFLGVPNILLSLVDISPLTARFAAAVLQHSGLEVVYQSVLITLPTGTLRVDSSCSGVESISYLVGIAVVCLTLYPVSRLKQIVALFAAPLIAFAVNGVRVAMMACLMAPQDQQRFLYWNEGDGSLISGIATLGLFGGLYWLLYRLEIWQKQRLLS